MKNFKKIHSPLGRVLRSLQAKNGFTLVELIVVITILVILGTIAFVNLGNFSNSARDSVRISDITNITQGLELTLIKNGTVPPPSDNTLTLSASGTPIGYQGYFGSTNLSLINMSDARDPTDQKYYTYSTNLSRTKYQLLALLEDSNTLTSYTPYQPFPLIPQIYAGYETRIPTTKGSSLGILLGNAGASLNQPVQELYNAVSFTGVDVVNTQSGYIAIVSNQSTDQFNGTGLVLSVVASTMRTGGSRYPGCDTYDIFITNGSISQTWAACNVGATTSAGFATVPAQSPNPTADGNIPPNRVASVQGNYYQWGRNDNVTTGTWTTSQWTGTLTSPANTTSNTNFYQGDATYGDWHWAGVTNPVGGWNVANGGDNQGPCATGYHIPTTDATITTTDWKTASLLIVGTASPATTQFDTIRSTLKLPLAGYRYWNNGQYYVQGTNGYYWSSSPTTTYSYNANFNAGGGGIAGNGTRGIGFSLRCLKN